MTAAQRGKSARRKGNEAEKAAARWLTARGWPTETTRNAERGAGRQSVHGDLHIAAAPDIIIDVKDRGQLAIAAWLEQLEAECGGQGHRALWVKVAGVADPGRWLMVAAEWAIAWHHSGAGVGAVDAPLDKRTFTDVLGWLRIENENDPPAVLCLHESGVSSWSLMFADTWADDVLPAVVERGPA